MHKDMVKTKYLFFGCASYSFLIYVYRTAEKLNIPAAVCSIDVGYSTRVAAGWRE